MTRRALVIPGGQFGPHTPLLMFAADAAEARGVAIQHVYWSPPADLRPADRVAWATAEVSSVVATGRPLLIAKSLGTCAAPLAAEHDLPAVWLTPLLKDEQVVAGLRRATAPRLLVGGTADGSWDGALARELSPHVCEIDGANHGMYVPGPLAASAAVLGLVVTAIELFLAEIGC